MLARLPSSFLSSRVVYEWTKEARERERLPSPSSPLKNCLDEIPSPRYTPLPSSVLHLISLLSSNYRNKIIISRRFLLEPPPLPSPFPLFVEKTRSRIRADIGLPRHVLMTLEF